MIRTWVKKTGWPDWLVLVGCVMGSVSMGFTGKWSTILWPILAGFFYIMQWFWRNAYMELERTTDDAMNGWRESIEREKKLHEVLAKHGIGQPQLNTPKPTKNLRLWGNP